MYSATTISTMIWHFSHGRPLAFLTLWVLLPAPVWLSPSGSLAKRFMTCTRKSRRRSPRSPPRVQENLAGVARRPRLRAGRSGNPRLRRAQPRVCLPQHQTHPHLEHVHAFASGAHRHNISVVLSRAAISFSAGRFLWARSLPSTVISLYSSGP